MRLNYNDGGENTETMQITKPEVEAGVVRVAEEPIGAPGGVGEAEPTTAAQQSTSDPRPGKAPSGSVSGLIVTLFEPTGYLLRIEHEGGSITLDRAETWALYLELQNKIGAMPFKL